VLNEIQAVFFVEVKDGFAVAVGLKMMAELFQSLAQLDEVIDFSVGDERERAVFVVKGLPAAVEIDDAEATHRQHHVRVLQLSRAIRTAMREFFIRGLHAGDVRGRERGLGNDSSDTTHSNLRLSRVDDHRRVAQIATLKLPLRIKTRRALNQPVLAVPGAGMKAFLRVEVFERCRREAGVLQ